MTENIKFERYTIVATGYNTEMFFKDLSLPIQAKILKNQERATDLEKRIVKFMDIVYSLNINFPHNPDLQRLLDQAVNIFGVIEVKK